tara:strand:+ start:545 stop:748 length:204 start_codon:yes stop_codon:yes gene_type:complete
MDTNQKLKLTIDTINDVVLAVRGVEDRIKIIIDQGDDPGWTARRDLNKKRTEVSDKLRALCILLNLA